MPLFIDYHEKVPAIPKEQIDKMRAELGKPDALGTRDIDMILTKDGRGYCITEAQNADAVCKSHEAAGIKLDKGDVHEIQTELRQ